MEMQLMLPTEAPQAPQPLFRPAAGRVADYALQGAVDAPELYGELLEMLRTAEPNDTVNLYINTPGGVMETALEIIDAIDQCRGTVIGHLTGIAYSAGSLIFLACPQHRVNRFAELMMHRESSQIAGKGSDLEVQQKFHERFIRKLYSEIYGPFLTKAELTKLLRGNDLFFDTEQIIERLANLGDN